MLAGILEWMAKRISQRHSNDINLLFALATTRECLATDPRDKVFALLGLVSNPSEVGFEPDYHLTSTEVYTLTAAHLITSLNTLSVISYVDGPSASNSRPSWVPSWSGGNNWPLKAQFTKPGMWSSKET